MSPEAPHLDAQNREDKRTRRRVELETAPITRASAEDTRAVVRVVSKKLLGSDLLTTAPSQPEGSQSVAEVVRSQ
jgi:hypothetical protein